MPTWDDRNNLLYGDTDTQKAAMKYREDVRNSEVEDLGGRILSKKGAAVGLLAMITAAGGDKDAAGDLIKGGVMGAAKGAMPSTLRHSTPQIRCSRRSPGTSLGLLRSWA